VGGGQLKPSCLTAAQPGQVVATDSGEVREYVKGQLSLLRSGHPEDCMTCDANGRCELQDLCTEYQVGACCCWLDVAAADCWTGCWLLAVTRCRLGLLRACWAACCVWGTLCGPLAVEALHGRLTGTTQALACTPLTPLAATPAADLCPPLCCATTARPAA
jgi:hypothetical protein